MAPRLLHYSDIENAYDTPERIGRLAGLISDRRDEGALVVGTGDNTAPGVLAMVTEAQQALDFFRGVEPDAETFGNHDFDFGPERTLELVRDSPQPWLSTNIYRNGTRFGAAEGVAPWIVLEADGDRVGLFGVIDPKTSSMVPSLSDEFGFTDPITAADEAVTALHDQSVDHIVALSHVGHGDADLAAAVDIDVVLGGHIHSERIEYKHDTLLTRPGPNGAVLLEITLDGSPTATKHEVSNGPIDATVQDALDERMRAVGLDEVIAHVADPVERTSSTTYEGECRIGNFVADAYRWAGDADIGLVNSGSLRAGPALAGDVTVGDLASVVPFGGPVAVAEVTGEELTEVFRQGDSALVEFGDDTRWYAQISGARITYDHANEALVEATVAGELIDPDRTYSLATSEFVLWTDIEFPALTPKHQQRTLDTQYEVLVAYAREHGISPQLEGRVARRNTVE